MSAIHKFLLVPFCLMPMPTALAETHSWQGPYVGIYTGAGFGNNHTSTDVGGAATASYFSTAADIDAVTAAGTSTNHPGSGIIGLKAGHDWIWQKMVYGVSLDYGALPLSSSNRVSTPYASNSNQYSISTSMRTNWLFTLRGRVGYETIVRWPALLYLTGGMAMTQLSVKNSFADNSPLAGAGGKGTAENQIGWTVGAGIELVSFEHATLDIEYLYVHMPAGKTTGFISNTKGGFGIPAQSLTSPFSTIGQFHASVLKIGLNYPFEE